MRCNFIVKDAPYYYPYAFEPVKFIGFSGDTCKYEESITLEEGQCVMSYDSITLDNSYHMLDSMSIEDLSLLADMLDDVGFVSGARKVLNRKLKEKTNEH